MPQIKALQVFRGLAALAVVIFHGALSTTTYVDPLPSAAASIFGKGYLGVDFFFVLSGFIIMYAHARDKHSFGSVRRYAYKRLVRIFPAYLPITIAMIVVYASFPALSATGGRDYSMLSSLLLVPADRPPILTVAWSLVHEIQFYAIFLVFFLSRRLFFAALLVWVGAIVAINLDHEPTNWLRYPLSLLNIEFMLGVCAAWAVTTKLFSYKPQWLVMSGFVVSTIVLMIADLSIVGFPRIVFAAGLALMIVGFAQWEEVTSIAWPAWLVLMGNASYSIYLLHNQAFSVTQRVNKHAGLNWAFGMVFGVLVALLAGYLYHLAVEQRAVQFFGNRLRPKGRTT